MVERGRGTILFSGCSASLNGIAGFSELCKLLTSFCFWNFQFLVWTLIIILINEQAVGNLQWEAYLNVWQKSSSHLEYTWHMSLSTASSAHLGTNPLVHSYIPLPVLEKLFLCLLKLLNLSAFIPLNKYIFFIQEDAGIFVVFCLSNNDNLVPND